ncbi:MAG TPA: hypothetical protein VN327_10485, partial [Pseudonocardiaceae bacterium]|nr:hypothetical protein [Pseudonocardiaceae bacterium]
MDHIAGEWRNGIQRVHLAQGLSMRPTVPIPHTNAAAYHHSDLKRMIDTSEPSQAHELGQLWNDLDNEIMDFGASLQRTATSSEAIWVGQAGNAARAALSALAAWSQHTGQGVQFMGTTVRTQAEAAQTAKLAMPEPVPYDPAEYQAQLNSTINPAEWVRIIGDAREQADRRDDAHAEAIRVVENYSTSLRDTNTAMPAFTPPPRFGNGDTGLTPGVPTPGGRAGGALPPAGSAGGKAPGGSAAGSVPGIGGGSPPTAVGTSVGGHGSGGTAPASTPGQSVSYAPEIPGGVPAGGSGGEPGGPSFLPAAAVIGEAGPGGRGSSAGGRRVGGGFGPRGSAGLGDWKPRTSNPHTWNPRTSNPDSNPLGRGGVGSAGAGAGNGFTPMAGTGRGEEDTEHRRPSYL